MHPGSPSDSPRTLVVAIDGPAGSGKSTLARLLADRLDFRFLDSGAMYRSLTFKALREGVATDDGPALAELLSRTEIRLIETDHGHRALLDGEDVSIPIRSPEINAAVSRVAAQAEVRYGMVDLQRDFARGGAGVVVEGRDIGTVVFPDAQVKFFLDASPEERARRRAAQAGTHADDERDAMHARDEADRGRTVAPLVAADDAEVVDTTGLTLEQVLDRLCDSVRRKTGAGGL